MTEFADRWVVVRSGLFRYAGSAGVEYALVLDGDGRALVYDDRDRADQAAAEVGGEVRRIRGLYVYSP